MIRLLPLYFLLFRQPLTNGRGEAASIAKLLDEVRSVARRKPLSIRTEEADVNWLKRFILFHNQRHPREMGELEIRPFLSCLAVEQGVAASTQNVALAALVFLYRDVLKQGLSYIAGIERAKRLYEFSPVRADPVSRLLRRDGQPVALTPKAFDPSLPGS